MKAFVIVVTQENRLRFRMMKKEHGLLHDKKEKKSYAIVRDAYPTNWAGRFARAYLVHETAAQTIILDGESVEIHGGTTAVKDPLNMVAKVRLGSRRGTEGQEHDVHLTAETIFDRTESVQVRRLGNRRFQWFHALAFVCVGIALGLMTVGVITLFSSHASPPASNLPPVVVTPGSGPSAPQSGPAPAPASSSIIIQHGPTPRSGGG